MSPTPEPEVTGVLSLRGELSLFGFPPREVTVEVRPRSTAWRMTGAARTFGIFALVAPVVGILPPHAPWALGALGVGAILARKRWSEEFTLERLEGTCPKCDSDLRVHGVRLRFPHPVTCEGCHHQVSLKIPEGLEGCGAVTGE